MEEIQISICLAAQRSKWWKRMCDSMIGNKINYEVIFVGNVPPVEDMGDHNFTWIKTNVKPAQAYEIAFRQAKGELVSWSADDATYGGEECNLDKAYEFYKSFNDYKVMVGNRTVEDGHDCHRTHHFFGGEFETTTMIPMGFISNKFMKELGGYDRSFVSGQSENDLVMRGVAAGGRVEICPDSYVYLHHREVHPENNRNLFRASYKRWDRVFLERSWVNPNCDRPCKVDDKRQTPFEPFEEKDILIKTQGEKGYWQ